jgi:hypothetical protein
VSRLLSEEAPIVPLYFNYASVAYATPLAGPEVRAPGGMPHANIYEWQWR